MKRRSPILARLVAHPILVFLISMCAWPVMYGTVLIFHSLGLSTTMQRCSFSTVFMLGFGLAVISAVGWHARGLLPLVLAAHIGCWLLAGAFFMWVTGVIPS